jgi:hypothetical protein
VIILAEHGDVAHLAERIHAAVAAMDWTAVAPGLRLAVTVGTAPAGPGALHRADAALLASRRDARSPSHPPRDAGTTLSDRGHRPGAGADALRAGSLLCRPRGEAYGGGGLPG